MKYNPKNPEKQGLYPVDAFSSNHALKINDSGRLNACYEFLNQSFHYTWILDENRKLVYTNNALNQYFQSEGTIVTNNILTSRPGQLSNTIITSFEAAIKSHEPVKTIFKSTPADGSTSIFQVTAFFFTDENGNKLIGGEAVDITAIYEAEQEVKRINERLLYITHATSEAIWEWNLLTGHIYRNIALYNMIGIQPENTQDLSWWFNRIHPEDRKKTKEQIDCVLLNKRQSWESEYRFLCADNSYKVVYDHGFVVYENNQPVKMIGSLQDISETRELENQLLEEKLKKQKELAEAIINTQEEERTRIAHELHDNVNQLLTTAKLFVEMLRPTSENDILMVKKTKEILMAALGEIRDISKNMTVPFLRDQGLAESIDETLEYIRVTKQYDIQFTTAGDNETAISEGKKIALFRILQEQLKNIIKHSQAKMMIVHLDVEQSSVKLKISDDGIGFDASKKNKGIGLSNIYDRIKLYEGTVELKTAPQMGCELTVTLPL